LGEREGTSMAKVLFVIAPDKFRDEELFETRDEIQKAGHQSLVTSTEKGKIESVKGGYEKVRTLVSDVNLNEFDAVVFVGGGGMRVLFEEATIINIAKEMYSAGKVVAAICIAPIILVNAGLLKGKQATVYKSEISDLERKGAKYIDLPVVVDGKIVTGNGPNSSRLFAQEINKLL